MFLLPALWKRLLALRQLRPRPSAPRDIPHLAFASPSGAHPTSRNGGATACGSPELRCRGSGAAAAASPLPGVAPARTRGNTAAAPSLTTQPASILRGGLIQINAK